MRHEPGGRHVVRWRGAGDHADALILETRILELLDAVETGSGLEHQRIGRTVIGIGRLDEIVSERIPHHDIAAARQQRHADEACRLRVPFIGEVLAELARKKLGKLVLEAFASLRRERHVARVGADAQRLRVDELERRFGRRRLRLRLRMRERGRGKKREELEAETRFVLHHFAPMQLSSALA